ncbi:MAG: DUF3343 domain-containing protein [Peptoniphilaceae bacterium]|jgi:hypothetical protein
MKKTWLLFHDVRSAMQLHTVLRTEGMKISIAPTPREAAKCCGVSILLADAKDTDRALQMAEEAGIQLRGIHTMDADFNPGRDRYC